VAHEGHGVFNPSCEAFETRKADSYVRFTLLESLQTQTTSYIGMGLPSAILAAIAAYGMLYGALLIPPSVLSHKRLAAVFLPLIWACDFYDIRSGQGGLGPSAVIHAFRATDLLLFRNPREDFKIIHRKSCPSIPSPSEKREDWKETYPKTFWARLWWVNNVICSLRFTGLDTGDNHHSTEVSMGEVEQSRGRWLMRECWRATWYFLIIDASNAYGSSDPYFLGQTGIDAPLPNFLLITLGSVSRYCFMPRSIRIVIFGLQQYAIFSMCGSVAGIFFVSLHGLGLVSDFWGHPSNWPPLMGNPLVMFGNGLRGLWGKVWHQIFRHVSIRSLNMRFCASADIPRSLQILERRWHTL
jgi:hypothetical protein